jgi:hypothetical protein
MGMPFRCTPLGTPRRSARTRRFRYRSTLRSRSFFLGQTSLITKDLAGCHVLKGTLRAGASVQDLREATFFVLKRCEASRSTNGDFFNSGRSIGNPRSVGWTMGDRLGLSRDRALDARRTASLAVRRRPGPAY